MNSLTNTAAWWGAVIATIVLMWDIYKWFRSGPILHVTVGPNMQTLGNIPNHPKNQKYISVEVTNTGSRKTTITHLVSFYYKSFIFNLFKKPNKNFVVLTPAFLSTLPHIIEPGGRWLGGIEQNIELEELSRNGYLFCGIYHSSSKKPVMQRVVIHKNNNK